MRILQEGSSGSKTEYNRAEGRVQTLLQVDKNGLEFQQMRIMGKVYNLSL